MGYKVLNLKHMVVDGHKYLAEQGVLLIRSD